MARQLIKCWISPWSQKHLIFSSVALFWMISVCFTNMLSGKTQTLRWRKNERDSVSNHQPHDCLLNRLLRRRSKKTSKLRVTGLCVGNSQGTGEFPAQMASYAENVSIWWRHHEKPLCIPVVNVFTFTCRLYSDNHAHSLCFVVLCCGLTSVDFTHTLPLLLDMDNHTSNPMSPHWRICLNKTHGLIKT